MNSNGKFVGCTLYAAGCFAELLLLLLLLLLLVVVRRGPKVMILAVGDGREESQWRPEQTRAEPGPEDAKVPFLSASLFFLLASTPSFSEWGNYPNCQMQKSIIAFGGRSSRMGDPSTLELSAWIFPVSGFVRLVSGRVCGGQRFLDSSGFLDSRISGFLVLVEGNDV